MLVFGFWFFFVDFYVNYNIFLMELFYLYKIESIYIDCIFLFVMDCIGVIIFEVVCVLMVIKDILFFFFENCDLSCLIFLRVSFCCNLKVLDLDKFIFLFFVCLFYNVC